MPILKVNVNEIKHTGWAFVGDTWIVAHINNAHGYSLRDVELTDYFEDWEHPT